MKSSLFLVAASVLLLAGCGNQSQPTHKADSTQSKTSVKPKTAHKTSNSTAKASSNKTSAASSAAHPATKATLAWSEAQDGQLASFMQDFGAQMNQQYTEFLQTAEFEIGGLELNQYFQGHPAIEVNGVNTPIAWLPTAGHFSSSAANIVAAYLDRQDQILYFFALSPDGTPHAWVTQELRTPFNAKESSNQQVQTAFKQIAAGKPSTTGAVDMKNLSTAQVKDWILRNIQRYAPTTYPNYPAAAFNWSFSKDAQGQLAVMVSENHDYMNAHYHLNADPDTAPTVGSFVVTSAGQLQASGIGTVGTTMVQKVSGSMIGDAIIAKSFTE